MVWIKCKWCEHEFDRLIIARTKSEVTRNQVKCPKCFRMIPSSIKISTGNVIGAKHYHEDY